MAEDIRNTGPVGLTGLKGINQQSEDDYKFSLEELDAINKAYGTNSGGVSVIDTSSLQSYEGTPMEAWGQSKYDDSILNAPMDSGQIQDTRYENQSWYDTLANGIGKMLGTAGTTFVSSLIGLPYGVGAAINQGRWSALWDNDVTQGLAEVDKWLEENMTNYRSQVQQNSPWYSPDNLFSMNFIADDVIKNAGFTLGAAASMAVGSGSFGLMSKALGFVNDVSKGTKMGQAALSALFAATGEGMIEARQGVDERNKLEMQRLDDELAPEYESLQMIEQQARQRYEMTGDFDTYRQEMMDIESQKQLLDQRKEAGIQQIQESGQDMGNTILLANQALLTAGNLIQFGKGMVKSFDSARHAAETAAKAAKPFGVKATKAGAASLKEGYRITGKNFGKAVAATKGLLTEGSEEMNQQWIQSAAGAYYDKEDINDYWKARLDPEATKDTTEGLYTLGKAIDRGFQESWGDPDQWEQFVIGGLTGMAGSYSPTKLFNQDKTKGRLNPKRYGSWEGGAYNEVRDFNQKYNQYEENINEVNSILNSEDFPERVKDMVGHTYTETDKTTAAEEDNKKAWKDADDKQFIHDIQSFLRAGKLDDLRAIYNEMGSNLSDEDVASIRQRTTQELKDEEGKTYYEGPYVDKDGNHIITDDGIREIIKHNTEELNRKVDSYLDSIEAVNEATHGTLSKDQEDNLVYLHNLGREKLIRADKIIADKRKQMPPKFLLKTDKSPEQLTREYASSDLVFSKDNDTREGYVEVDTSLMDNTSFRNFFVRDLLWGGNIMPEFGETADEKAAREEEEKNLSEEERRKKARERASKKWKDALERREKEAQQQRDVNGELMEEYFRNLYNKKGTVNKADADRAVNDFFKDILDVSILISEAGEYDRTLQEYMTNPSKVDEDKAKEENKSQKAAEKQKVKNQFEGKTASEIKQDIADGDIDFGDLDDFIRDTEIKDEDLAKAQQVAKNVKESNQKAAALKQHILESDAEPEVKEAAMAMVDQANLQAETPEDINISSEAFKNLPLDMVSTDASPEEIARKEMGTQEVLAKAFNDFNIDEAAQDVIPDTAEQANDAIEAEETGYDATVKMKPGVVAPDVQSPSEATNDPLPKNPLTEGAIDEIIKATSSATAPDRSDVGIWRSCTTRHIYGKSIGTYHDNILTDKGSIRYKRSKAIWEYLNSTGAFDRLDNSSNDRIKEKDPIHFMVRNMSQEIYGKDYSDLTDKEKPFALVILMLKDQTMEVLGDLPLAQFEVDYGHQEEGSQLAHLISLQNKVFKAFDENYRKTGNNETVVDNAHKDGADNLNLTFDSKRPLMSKVKQVMRGAVPLRKSEINTLNDVANGQPFELGVRVSTGRIAKRQGDSNQNYNIRVPVGKEGQPYLLLPTPSGEQMAVPFYMKPFDATQHRNTEMYKLLSNAVHAILVNNTDKEVFKKNMDILKGLLQVEPDEKAGKVIEIGKDSATMHLQSLTDISRKITVTVPLNQDTSELARAIVDQLSGIPINVSLQFLNDTIEAEERKADYNNVIGEIADISLPKNTTHTVNGWFTVELAPPSGIRPSRNVAPRTTGNTSGSTTGVNEENSTLSANGARLDSSAQTQPKTLEQIEEEMKQKKIVGRQTQDAWNAIPDNLKLKMVNEEQPLQLTFRGKKMVVSTSNREGLIQGLTQANMAAKAGNLTVTEAPKPMEKTGVSVQKENEQTARRWLAQNLPSLSSEERTQFVDNLARMGNDGGKYWGSYRSGVIQIQRNAPMGTVYHESFHYIMDMVLSPEEKSEILDIAKAEYGINDNWKAEERLAEDFRRYAMDENAEGFTGRLRRFFRKLLDRITRYNRISDATVNQLFWKINNGELAQKSTQAENFEENQQMVLREIRNVQKEKFSWKNLPNDTRKNLLSSGLSEAAYEQMSLEEKSQYVKCRG